MTAGPWLFTDILRTYILNGTLDFDTDAFKVALFKDISNIGAASTIYSALTNEVANGFGYLTGGASVTLTLSGTTDVNIAASASPSYTASGGSITARFAVLYKVSGGAIVAYALLDNTPADLTISNGNTLTVGMTTSVAHLT